ncbi:MAG: hypothetical protein ABIN57_10025 [Chitinophagaceae bacterium]
MINGSENKVVAEVNGTRKLYFAMVGGLIVFLAVSLAINKLQGPFLKELRFLNTFLIATFIISIIALLVANRLYHNKSLAVINAADTIEKKMEDYRSVLLATVAIAEFPALISIIGSLITGNYIFLAIAALVIAFLLKKIPTEKNFIQIVGTTASSTSF